MEALDMRNQSNTNKASVTLAALLPEVVTTLQLADYANMRIIGLALDSRHVERGDLFLAVPGTRVDGRAYLAQAIRNGAVGVLAHSDDDYALSLQDGVPVFAIPELNRRLSDIADRFFGSPSKSMVVVGVTGTNGKTTCSQMIGAMLSNERLVAEKLAGEKTRCGIVGTLGVSIVGDGALQQELLPITTGLTTPDAITLQQCLAELKGRDCSSAVLEVSSHALAQYRAEAVAFDFAVFTNLSRDHLDFHQDMATYAEAKRKLFRFSSLRAAIVNMDDPVGRDLLKELSPTLDCFSYSLIDSDADIFADQLRFTASGVAAVVHARQQSAALNLPFMGKFNLSNALASVAVGLAAGMSLENSLGKLSTLSAVPGRMQQVSTSAELSVVVDFAHTPEALEQAIAALKTHTAGKLCCVFGCGGDRDRGKRAEMGRVARALADTVVVTSDNPRHEQPQQIIDDVLLGIDNMRGVLVEVDRAKAIEQAITQATAGDLILIAGKGHEQFQYVGDAKLVFSDIDVARAALQMRGDSR